jgi:hypothetical protein
VIDIPEQYKISFSLINPYMPEYLQYTEQRALTYKLITEEAFYDIFTSAEGN